VLQSAAAPLAGERRKKKEIRFVHNIVVLRSRVAGKDHESDGTGKRRRCEEGGDHGQ
jgi:hypothetical protein